MSEILRIEDLCAGYGDLQVLFDINLHVDEGEIVTLVGSNGAGKTTILRLISGLEKIKSGRILYEGEDLAKVKPHMRAPMGIAHIPQGRGILRKLTVKENLVMGALSKRCKNVNEKIEEAYQRFPILKERQNQIAGSLSGGEQQMLAISRALIMEPKILIMDEPSLGLAPIVVKEIFKIIENLADSGLSILLIEQNLTQALGVAHRGYVIETGHIVMEGDAKELLAREDIQSAYLGI